MGLQRMPELTEAELVASITRERFFEFVKEFWETIIQEDPVWNWHIPYICDELQHVAERVFAGKPKEYDLIINVPPGTTKSTLISILFPAWVWTRMAHARFISASYTHTLALDLARKSRDVIRSDKYTTCFPHLSLRSDQDTKGYYVNNRKGDRFSAGVGGTVTGMHGHFILIDDPLDPTGAKSQEEIKTANQWVSETIPSRKVNKSIAPTIMVMQRLHQNDPTGFVLGKQKGNVRHICLPGELSDKIRPAVLAACYRNGLLDPIRLSKGILEEARTDLGPYGYACQFDQHPIPREGGMFKVSKLMFEKGIPQNAKFVRIVRYWDKAGTHQAGCYTVGLKMGVTADHQYWVLDVVRGQWATEEREARIVQTAQLDGKGVIIGLEQEGGSGGLESAQATTKRLAGYRVRIDIPKGDKEVRADEYSVQVNIGNVHVPANASWLPDYITEMEYFPSSTYKDQIDASSGAFGQLTKVRHILGALPGGEDTAA